MFGNKVTFKSLSAYPMKVQVTRIFLALICITIFSCSSDNGVNPPGGGNSIDRIFIADINGESFAPNSITTSVSGGFITILGVMNSVQSNIEFELKIPEDVTPNVYRYDGTTWDAFLDVNNSSLGQNTYVPLEAEGDFTTYISRIRKDNSNVKAINIWVVSDNLLKGAALNTVQIAEHLVKKL